jgi:decaprenylphospho-beta-D-ribofuranose 2-oxidase
VIKRFKSIDGFFNNKLKYQNFKENTKLNKKKISLLGSGNSISGLPFEKKSILLNINLKDRIIIDKKKLELTANGNIEIYKIHNNLLKNSLYFTGFPSYPSVRLGACVANSVHGLNPKSGCLSNFVKKIKIYNPNFGYKVLTPKKNANLFHLTIGGMGLTGIIIEVTIKVFKLKSTYIKTKPIKVKSILEGYKYLKKTKNLYNQNNFFIDAKKENFSEGIIITGNFFGKVILKRNLKKINIKSIRLGVLDFYICRKLLEKILIFFQSKIKNKIIHLNEALFPSNNRLTYFNLLTKKFIEHQVIIPEEKIKNYLEEFEKIIKKNTPSITLCHLKIFSGNNKFLQFNGKGLGITIHLIINKKFNTFYSELLKLNLKYSCKINLYKNSMVNLNLVKKNYKRQYKIFESNIKKINKNYNFTNKIFNNNFYNDYS